MPVALPVHPDLSRLTSGYGTRPGRTTGAPTYHAGLDFRGSVGEPVYAVADGVVEFTADESDRRSRTRGYGNVIAIRHPHEGVYSLYAHLERKLVRVGQAVQAGELIGLVGRTTNRKFLGMGPHLHFELRRPRPDGSSPVPGPYRAFNIDPRAWLEERGARITPRGFDLDPGVIRPAMMAPLPALAGFAGGLAGLGLARLGQLLDPTVATEADADYNRQFIEPVADPSSFDPTPPFTLVAIATVVGAAALGAGWLLYQDYRGAEWGWEWVVGGARGARKRRRRR